MLRNLNGRALFSPLRHDAADQIDQQKLIRPYLFQPTGDTIMAEPPVDTDRIDEAVLALMYLTLHHGEQPGISWRAWKSFDWSSLDRLYDKGLILDPLGKAKSVALTDEGHRRCEEAFRRLFTKPD